MKVTRLGQKEDSQVDDERLPDPVCWLFTRLPTEDEPDDDSQQHQSTELDIGEKGYQEEHEKNRSTAHLRVVPSVGVSRFRRVRKA